VGGVYENHNIGVWYNNLPLSPWRGHWCIFNQDLSAMPTGAAFTVIGT
jgi:hypothetical protein